MHRLLLIVLYVISLLVVKATTVCAKDYTWQTIPLKKAYIYRLYLNDKQHSPYSIDHPEKYLSERAINRRKRQGIAIDSTDLPVSPTYIDNVKSKGLTIMGTSRWHNTITVASSTDNVAQAVQGLPYIRKCLLLYKSPDSLVVYPREKVGKLSPIDSTSTSEYGDGYKQINLLNGTGLHAAGFKGKGMLIAIIDAGFRNADKISTLKTNIKATADFSPRRTSSIFTEHYHGTMVLSTMAANKRNVFIGTAPEADYALIRSEDFDTETRAEEDSWTMAAEFADSIGADLINSSLGYSHWDGDSITIHLRDLNGHTAYISQTASMLASKGIILCNSAGNEGSSSWHKINVPADADNILTVGAVDFDKKSATFSSLGPSQDGRVKPDVCGPGKSVYVIDGSGMMTTNSGTSFASPIVCGMTACLWQALPELNAKQIISLVRQSADRNQWPDNVYGYGIPDYTKALSIGKKMAKERQK